MPTSFEQIHAAISECMLTDRAELLRRWHGLRRRAREGKPFDRGLAELESALQAAQQRMQQRAAQRPAVSYPEELPVSTRREDIAAAIAAHQVVVIAGETGSGKTTQLPKICLELGRGVAGLIGHTQPRRIAARSVAARIAEELKTPLGQAVGYKVRFTDRTSPQSHIKLMTDGILLAEVQGDRDLLAYDTLIIDEAHERSLNIDFLLGYLKQLLPRRPDLKLIITSATINTERFAAFFDGAPVLEVSGRTWPVEVRYRPVAAEDGTPDADEDSRDRDLPQAITEAIDEVGAINPLGDVLVFLPGEREIREMAEALRKHHLPHTEVVPLFGRLSAAEQDRVFQPHGGRRIVLATNVAETSLTVPGIRYVIDSGLARISRYSPRTKVQRLPIEAISQAAANQRAGRCGRVAAGVCIRLYSEEDFLGRPLYTDPEIWRTNLAAVILQMGALGLGDVEDFPFPDPPDSRAIGDGFQLLHELGAMDSQRRLTDIGRQLARLPLDPRLGRMLLAAEREGSLHEVMIIASALTVQDPRERPLEAQQQSDQKHARFSDPEQKSDFLAWLKLWDYYHEQARHLSQSKLRALCRAEFLSYVRLREWHDIHGQLMALVNELKLRINEQPADYGAIHRALLSGLLGNVALKGEDRQFLGTRNIKLNIFPGSSQFRKPPKWIMAAELVETTKLYARSVAAIEPEWLEPLARHLVKRSWFEPHWEKKSAQVSAYERVTLYGLPIVEKRRVNYGPIDPKLARELFIRHALVEGDFHTRAPFFAHNRQLVAEVEELEAKARKRDILVDEQVLFDFYDARLPAGIYSGKSFEKWREEAEREDPQLLFLTREALMQHAAGTVTENQFPDVLRCDNLAVKLDYHFEPGHAADGVTAIIPLAALTQVNAQPFDWLVPGLLKDKLIALIKTLPKQLRRNFVPAVNFAEALLAVLRPGEGVLLEAAAHQLKRMSGIDIPPDAWQAQELPPHLRMNYRVVDERGKVLGEGRDLAVLQGELSGKVRHTLTQAVPQKTETTLERDGLTDWDFDTLPASIEVKRHGLTLRAWPALVDQGESVAIRLFESEAAAQAAQCDGLLRLFLLRAREKVKYLRRNLPGITAMCMHYAAVGGCEEFKDELVTATCREAFLAQQPWPCTRAEFVQRLQEGEARLLETGQRLCAALGEALVAFHAVNRKLKGSIAPALLPEMNDVQAHLQQLVARHFVLHTPYFWLLQYPRYLKAVQARLDKCGRHPARERENRMALDRLWQPLATRLVQGMLTPEQEEFRWLLEELRVSLYAQELKTVQPVSVVRLEKLWQERR
ncbi:MAG: ATP-dependent RNA helicase HrpA [Pseudomonadota bacterium]